MLRNLPVASIFCSLHLKSDPWPISPALQNRNVSAPTFSINGSGSMALPRLLLIFRPRSSRPYPIIHASDHGTRPSKSVQRNSV